MASANSRRAATQVTSAWRMRYLEKPPPGGRNECVIAGVAKGRAAIGEASASSCHALETRPLWRAHPSAPRRVSERRAGGARRCRPARSRLGGPLPGAACLRREKSRRAAEGRGRPGAPTVAAAPPPRTDGQATGRQGGGSVGPSSSTDTSAQADRPDNGSSLVRRRAGSHLQPICRRLVKRRHGCQPGRRSRSSGSVQSRRRHHRAAGARHSPSQRSPGLPRHGAADPARRRRPAGGAHRAGGLRARSSKAVMADRPALRHVRKPARTVPLSANAQGA